MTLRSRITSAIPLPTLLRPLAAIASTRRLVLVRSAIYFAVVAAATVALVTTLPAERFYATSPYIESSFGFEVNGVLTDAELNYLRTVAEPGSLVTYVTLAPVDLQANGQSVSPAFVYLTDQSDSIGASWFPDSLVVESSEVSGPWLDLSAAAARKLAVAPGDWVDIPFLNNHIRGRVRRILAVAGPGSAFVAVGPLTSDARAILGSVEFGTVPTAATFRSSRDVQELSLGLAGVTLKHDWTIATRDDGLRASTTGALTAEPVLLVTTLLGLALLVALSTREAAHLVSRRTVDLSIMLAIGATRPQIIASIVLLESIASIVGLAAAYLLVRYIAYRFVFAPALPPPFVAPIAASLVVAGLAYVGGLATIAWRRLRTIDIVPVLSAAGTAH